jgi:hypothetical protein
MIARYFLPSIQQRCRQNVNAPCASRTHLNIFWRKFSWFLAAFIFNPPTLKNRDLGHVDFELTVVNTVPSMGNYYHIVQITKDFSMNYYEILEVSPNASKTDIKNAYYRISKSMHPDMIPLGAPEKMRKVIEENFKSINQAYEILSDSELREQYDANLLCKENKSTEYTKDNSKKAGNNSEKQVCEWLDPDKLYSAILKLDKRIENIKIDAEKRCSTRIYQVRYELESSAKKLGKNINLDNIDSLRNRDSVINLGIFLSILGIFFLNIRNWFIGLIGLFLLLISIMELIRGFQIEKEFSINL